MDKPTDRFVSPCPLPTEYEREILTILIEECAEVQQRATKLLRFGRDEVEPGQLLSNAERLSLEVGDLSAMVGMAQDEHLIGRHIVAAQIEIKWLKVAKFLQSKHTGRPLTPSPSVTGEK